MHPNEQSGVESHCSVHPGNPRSTNEFPQIPVRFIILFCEVGGGKKGGEKNNNTTTYIDDNLVDQQE